MKPYILTLLCPVLFISHVMTYQIAHWRGQKESLYSSLKAWKEALPEEEPAKGILRYLLNEMKKKPTGQHYYLP